MQSSHRVVTARCKRHGARMKQCSAGPNTPQHPQPPSWRLAGPAGQCSSHALNLVPSVHTHPQTSEQMRQPCDRSHTPKADVPRVESTTGTVVRASGPVSWHGVGRGPWHRVHQPSRSKIRIWYSMAQRHTPTSDAVRPGGRMRRMCPEEAKGLRAWGRATGGGDGSHAPRARRTETMERRASGVRRGGSSTLVGRSDAVTCVCSWRSVEATMELCVTPVSPPSADDSKIVRDRARHESGQKCGVAAKSGAPAGIFGARGVVSVGGVRRCAAGAPPRAVWGKPSSRQSGQISYRQQRFSSLQKQVSLSYGQDGPGLQKRPRVGCFRSRTGKKNPEGLGQVLGGPVAL